MLYVSGGVQGSITLAKSCVCKVSTVGSLLFTAMFDIRILTSTPIAVKHQFMRLEETRKRRIDMKADNWPISAVQREERRLGHGVSISLLRYEASRTLTSIEDL